jgi:S-formylglutathione hydrolase FrmB
MNRAGLSNARGLRQRWSIGRWAFALWVGLAISCNAQASTLKPFRFLSAALGSEQVAQVYVPDDAPPSGGWPVLYLLHGLDGTASDWQRLGNLQSSLDGLIAAHLVRPMVVVMPTGGNSWYVDSADVKGPGNYGSAIAHDLPAAVEQAFPVRTDRAHRAIAGLSMGGFGALRIGLAEPERFQAVAALSPAIWQNVPEEDVGKPAKEMEQLRSQTYFKKADPDDVTIGLDLPPPGPHFGGAFGTPFDARRFNAANVFTLLQKAVDARKVLPNVYLTVGDDDSHLLWRGAIAFFETMQMDNRAIEFRVTDGDHNWTCWRKSLTDALLFIDRQFGKPDLEKDAAR